MLQASQGTITQDSQESDKIKTMKHLHQIFAIIILTLLLSACQTEQLASTPTPAFVTATLPPTALAHPASPSPSSTSESSRDIQGVTTTKLNVRSEPSTSGDALGMLENAETVKVLGKDPTGTWYQIAYTEGSDEKGWVNATYIQVEENIEIPVIGGDQEGKTTVTIKETLNVRAEPSSSSASLGILNTQEVVTLTGKNPDGSWLQIEYPAGSDRNGWVFAEYALALEADTGSLPVVSDGGTPIGTVTPNATIAVPTFTLLPAPQDGDSAESPAAEVIFAPNGTRQFSFTGQVSSPEGDTEDWVAFTPYNQPGTQAVINFSLQCSGRGKLSVELWKNGQVISDTPGPACGDQDQTLTLNAGEAYQLHFEILADSSSLQSVGYIITILNNP